MRIADETIARLQLYGDRQSLGGARIRTTIPWVWVPVILRASAVTLGTNVCLRAGIDPTSTHPEVLALLAHECRHVRQYRELGTLTFLFRYLVGAVRARFVHDAHPLELEPIAIETQVLRDLLGRS